MAGPPPLPPPPPLPLPPPQGFPVPHMRLPPSNVVLLTDVPRFLHLCLREWIMPCGPARTILWFPKQLTQNDNETSKKSIALVTMMHGDGAWKLVYAVNQLNHDMKAHLVPASPDIPLPPVRLDHAAGLCDTMRSSYQELASGKTILMASDNNNSNSNNNNNNNHNNNNNNNSNIPKQLDTQKVAAAAGGHNYDEEADPLNAPAVLQAVKDFRKSLEKTNSVQQKRRIQLVQERLKRLFPQIRQEQTTKHSSSSLPPPPPPLPTPLGMPPPPPPLPPAPPPLPPPLPPPPPSDAAKESGKRGHSNLPAWMTKTPPPAKRARLDRLQQAKPVLKAFVASQIAEYLGEEEATLIDFVLNHVVEEKPFSALLQELKTVLEEDAETFVQALQTKIQQLIDS